MPLPSDPLAWAVKRFRDDGLATKYDNFASYYEGIQDLAFATSRFDQAFAHLFQALTYNRCPSVVDAIADRLRIAKFEAPDGKGDAQPAIDLWDANRMDKREGEVNVESLSEGDAYVITWPHPQSGQPVIWPQDAGTVRTLYDDEQPGLVILAVKLWKQEDDYLRLNLYLPNRLEKYISRQKYKTGLPNGAGWFEPYQPEGDLQWPLAYGWYRDNAPNIPVHHFGNNARTGRYGRSELADVIPLQDALNKSLADLMLGSEFAGFPQKYATGIKPDKDPATGKARLPFDVGVDRMVGAEDPQARFGQFDAANLAQMIGLVNMFDLCIARVSRVPVHYLGLTSEFPSGESLKTAEAPFVKKIEDRQRAFGNVWEDAMTLALRMGTPSIDLAFGLEAVYESAEPRTEREMAEIAVSMKTAGLPLPAILRMAFKLTEDEVTEVMAEADAMVERARAAFDAGELGNPEFGNEQDQEVA